ncbi:MAG: hypothetical protein VX640_11815 [Pseudomonadota bacterium]|nr:hypothetical protein [Pseudomonadota bacterium]
MGAVVRIVVFLVGLLAFALTGLNGAQEAGVDTSSLLTNLGPAEGAASSAQSMWGGLLGQLGGMMGDAMGADPENPGLVAQWGPEGVAGLVSALMMFFSTRR